MRSILLITFTLSLSIPSSAAASDPEWIKWRDEAVTLLQEVIKLDTSNPPGNERTVASHLERILKSDGIETKLMELAPGRANLCARIRGDGTRRPLILLSHTDVVPADAERWSVPPFAGVVRGGFVYGRGASDMKGTVAVHATLLRLLKRLKVPLKRDIILLAVADEEAGGTGARAIVEEHPELIRGAEFLLNEGDVAYVKDGRLQWYDVDVMEKAALWLRITASGIAGHGSVPLANSSVNRLLTGLAKLRAYEPPVRVPDAVQTSYRELANRQHDPTLRRAYADLREALKRPALRKRLLADATLNAQVRNTITITGLHGSDKVNVIPNTAWALVDVRLLPGDTPEGFLAVLRTVLADQELKIEALEASTPTGSSPKTALMDAIRRAAARRHPGVPVIPTLLTSSTDSPKFRALGITAYGFEPYQMNDDELGRSHGNDERLSVENVGFALHFLFDVVAELN